MASLPEDPTSFHGLSPAGMVTTPPNWTAYQRDSMSEADREAWDSRVEAVGGQIVRREIKSGGIRPGRRVAPSQIVSYYLVPKLSS